MDKISPSGAGTQRRPFSSATRNVIAAAALLLPSLTLIPLGGLYLFEHGWLLWWAGLSLATVTILSATFKIMMRPAERVAPVASVMVQPGTDPTWSDAEIDAWRDVLAIAARVNPDQITSLDYLIELGRETLNAVAQKLHPEKTDAIWRFTVPEALAITERVSRRLSSFVSESIPFGDSLTVAQALAAYRWRGVFDVAERAYDIWRIVRIVNPATAVTNEARERLSRAVYNYGKEHISRRLAEAYVEETGRAAIDLYGGRLMVASRLADQGRADPLQMLATRRITINVAVGGGTRAERLRIAAALASIALDRNVSAISAPSEAVTVLAEPVALTSKGSAGDDIVAELREADILVWVVTEGHHSEDAEALRYAVAAIKAQPGAVAPILIPVTIEESPIAARTFGTEAASAFEQPSSVVELAGITLDKDGVEPLFQELVNRLLHARRVHVVRDLASTKNQTGWRTPIKQAAKAAGMAAGALARAAGWRRSEPG